MPKAGGARTRTMFAYEKGLIWSNDNYRTNGAIVNVALATGNVGRPGGGCVRMGGHQEGYCRPSDAFIGRPAPYVDKLLFEGKGGVHHIWGCDHYKTTLNADQFKQNYKRRTDLVKDAMSKVPYGDRKAMVDAILAAIRQGGLFSVDVDIVPTQIGQASHVWLPAATAGEMNLTSMNGERRMRLTERYMDPPGQAMPDCLIAARLANHMETAFRDLGKADVADRFKGFDWKTEEDAFMDGYHQNEKGGQFVTYARLRAMGTNGFQEPAVGLDTTGRGRRRNDDGERQGASSAGPRSRARAARSRWRARPRARRSARRRPRRTAPNASSAPSASTPTASSTPRTAGPPSWRRPGAGSRRPASRPSRRSSGSSSTTAAPTTSGRAPTSTRRTTSSWTAGRSPTSR